MNHEFPDPNPRSRTMGIVRDYECIIFWDRINEKYVQLLRRDKFKQGTERRPVRLSKQVGKLDGKRLVDSLLDISNNVRVLSLDRIYSILQLIRDRGGDFDPETMGDVHKLIGIFNDENAGLPSVERRDGIITRESNIQIIRELRTRLQLEPGVDVGVRFTARD